MCDLMKQLLLLIVFIAVNITGCNSNSNIKPKAKSRVEPLKTRSTGYIIFGQYTNDNNSRWKQFYRISHDSIRLHFKGGSYYDYSQQKWIEKTDDNVSNQLLQNAGNKKVLALLKGIEAQFLPIMDSILGNTKNMNEQVMYVEIGNNTTKRYWKINELDTTLPKNIKALDSRLIEAIEILDPDNGE